MTKIVSSIKRPRGIKNVHIAVLTKNDKTGVTYDTPVQVKGIENFQFQTKYAEGNAFSDDIQDTNIKLASSIDIDLTFGQYKEEIASILQGHSTENGGLTVKTDDMQQEVALIFESGNSDGTKTYYVFYRCKLACEGVTLNTQGENIEFAKMNLKGKALPTDEGFLYRIIQSDTANLKEDFASTFYNAIVLPSAKVTNN